MNPQLFLILSAVFCEDPPVPDARYDMSVVKNGSYYNPLTLQFLVPLNGTVNYTCNAPGRFANDYNVNTFNDVVTCANLTDGSYNQITWPTCKRSKWNL